MAQVIQEKYNILLRERGFQKLETFLKIAIGRAEEFFIEINPEDDYIKFNCIDPSHISNVTLKLDNDDDNDFEINDLNSILQFNLKSQDLFKILTLNADSEIRIVPAIDEKNNFDMLKFIISQNNVITKEIFVPIMEATNEDLDQGVTTLLNSLFSGKRTLVIKIDLNYFIEILKESEIFNNERLRFNVSIRGKTIQKISIETFDNITDKTRRLKNNLFEGLHFGRVQLNNDDDNDLDFNILVSYTDLKKLAVTSKIYTDVNLILADKNPICVLYHAQDTTNNDSTLKTLLAPIIKEVEAPV